MKGLSFFNRNKNKNKGDQKGKEGGDDGGSSSPSALSPGGGNNNNNGSLSSRSASTFSGASSTSSNDSTLYTNNNTSSSSTNTTSSTLSSSLGTSSPISSGGGTINNNNDSTSVLDNIPAVAVKTLIAKTLQAIHEVCELHGEYLTIAIDDEQFKQKLSSLPKSEIRKHIDLLIGKRDVWSSESEEVFAFRYNIRKAHQMSENKSIERGDLLPPVYLTSDTSFDPNIKFYCKVNLVGDNFQRMVDCEPFMSADDFADFFINKINKSHLLNRKKEDWIFKATGTSEYIYGNERMIDFEVIRRCLKRGITRVQLNLMDKETVLRELDPYDMNLKTTDYDFEYKRTHRYSVQDHARFRKFQKDIHNRKHMYLHYSKFCGEENPYKSSMHDHDDDSNSFTSNSGSNAAAIDEDVDMTWIRRVDEQSNSSTSSTSTSSLTHDSLTLNNHNSTETLIKQQKAITLWDLHRPFRIKIMGIDNILNADNVLKYGVPGLEREAIEGDRLIYVTAQVFLGGMPLTNCRVTRCVLFSGNKSTCPRFNQYITFPELYTSELPREAKICLSVYSKPYSQNDPHLIIPTNRSPTIQDLVKICNCTIRKGVISENTVNSANSSGATLNSSGGSSAITIVNNSPQSTSVPGPNIQILGTSPISNPTDMNGAVINAAAVDDEEVMDHEHLTSVEGKKSKGDKNAMNAMPIGGLNFQLFNFCGTLKQGAYSLKLYPNKEARPIMTSGECKLSSIGISFCLDEYLLPVVYPDDEDSFSSCVQTDQTNTSFNNTLQELKERKENLSRSLSSATPGTFDNSGSLSARNKSHTQSPLSMMSSLSDSSSNTSSYTSQLQTTKPIAPNKLKIKHLPEHLTRRFEEYVAKKNSEILRSPEIIEKKLEKILHYDPLKTLNTEERWLCFTNRDKLYKNPKALSKFLLSVPWKYPEARLIAKEYLAKWSVMEPIDALELLDHNFGASFIREYSISRLNQLSDQQLCNFLLQLVQVLKFESYHDSALARFLLQRGLRSPNIIGHILFWHLKAEMYVPSICERHGLILEEYLRNCGSHRVALLQQSGVLNQLNIIAEGVKQIKDKEECKEYVRTCLGELKHPPKFKLPLSPRMEVKGIEIDRCRVMSSKKKPLWLVFQNADQTGEPIQVMFKAGDDLRQDLLTLQILSIMDQLWKKKSLDLHMNPYGCICTGDQQGFIELVIDSDTVANITAGDNGGIGAALNAFSSGPLEEWLIKNNGGDKSSKEYEKAVQNFTYSCAGYCAATYVLGIGDRHNDNIMLTRKGDLFHIDFGHFLGNYKKFKGVYKRETTPFVFSAMYEKVMKSYDQTFNTSYFSQFEELGAKAYNILRENGHLLMNLFLLMLATGIPELQSVSDIKFLRKRLILDETDEEAEKHFKSKIDEALDNTRSKLMDFVHIAKHK
ncbi:hypothetical protein FDP41_000734 [Naegleria fowleri]|uniref:phosphatidylinositol 3-kinase n=1 Tax=Naegleria fowleri TaxID=5763 RepID=A0A6A5CHQ7_NAEFO|nr:uncharacterized protein FDP41_000734 [Naegleria fowleri]KAF0984835.1 hypothetical protein FDP41_000734 [Naegleria fowleri]